ncbi:LacI family DNA-binding transcriptional regulator [Curtobacterium sp. B18]|uniref:LacI family DNA-binding transcriptional regulator n=1 Tax=Curtobacterium sp. B18 TaxID=95614 RepID=UPI0003B3839D|nr:LacI family DNA-binding transcriptional regulator [Curtobacterium sp. B18]
MDTARPTIYDVARLAGVSHQTVSRVLNHPTSTRPATRRRVTQAIAMLHYEPNEAAQQLGSSRPAPDQRR